MKFSIKFREFKRKMCIIIFLFLITPIFGINAYFIISYQNVSENPNNLLNKSAILYPKSMDNLLGIINTWREGIIVEGISLANDSFDNCYFVGNINYNFGNEYDILIGKLNNTNNIEWLNILSYNLIDKVSDIVLDINQQKGFILGETTISYTEKSNCLISSFNLTTGTILWNMTFGQPNLSEEGQSFILINDTLYVTGIQTQNYQEYISPNIFLACINSTDQNLLWFSSNSNDYYDCHPSIKFAKMRNEILLVFNRYEKIKSNYQFILQGLDFDGNVNWSFSSNTTSYPKVNDLIIIGSELIILGGDCYENSNYDFRDKYFAFFNLTNEELKEYNFGKQFKNEYITSLKYSEFYDIVICGYAKSDLSDQYVAFLAAVNLEGSIIWSRNSYEFQYSKLNDLIILSDNRIIMIGSAAYDYDFFLKRLALCVTLDYDRDSLSDYWEPLIGTDPTKADTDGDGYNDAEEYFASTDPLNPRSFPSRRKSLRNLGLATFIILVIGFSVLQIYFNILKRRNQAKNIQFLSIKLINFLQKQKNKIKKNKVND